LITITIPGRGNYRLSNLVLDLNGTIALDGELIEGVEDRLRRLDGLLKLFVVSADTFGSASSLIKKLKAEIHLVKKGEEAAQKLALVEKLGRDKTICIGNGANDTAMLTGAAIGIGIIGREGASVTAITGADVVVTDINAALELLLNTDRLVATLRG
jgi:P-type E1-E2 ATPase